MASMRVRIYGEKVLRVKAAEVADFDESLSRFLDDMVETMMAEDGVGLAANQVGVTRRIAVVNREPGNPATLLRLVNPKITASSDDTDSFEEGCLSVPGVNGSVVRPVGIEIEYRDEKGALHTFKAGPMVARIIQHELDHLDGVLFTDRLSLAKKVLIRRKLRELSRRSEGKG
jgi:peptide deformylase